MKLIRLYQLEIFLAYLMQDEEQKLNHVINTFFLVLLKDHQLSKNLNIKNFKIKILLLVFQNHLIRL